MRVMLSGVAMVLLVGLFQAGCAREAKVLEVYRLSDEEMLHLIRYRETHSYDDLEWLAENVLQIGMARQHVWNVLGPTGDGRFGEFLCDASTWEYTGAREIPEGSHLLIDFNNANEVVDFGWASE